MAKKQKFPHLVNSKWTSCKEMWGWRHFQVANRKNQKAWVFAEMVAACDDSVRFWVNATSLKNRTLWVPGWQSLNTDEYGFRGGTKSSHVQSFIQESTRIPRYLGQIEKLDDNGLIDLN